MVTPYAMGRKTARFWRSFVEHYAPGIDAAIRSPRARSRPVAVIPPLSRFHMPSAMAVITLALLAAVFVPAHPASAQSDASPCAAGGAVADPANNPGLVSDCDALLAARDTLAGIARLNWSASTHISQWDGVAVAGSPTRVTELNLSGRRLTGQIPTVLGVLSNLQKLDLYNNQLTGQIPTALGGLSNLQKLSLGNNQLTGQIPTSLGSLSNLVYLSLFANQLTGSIPAELGGLSNLAFLYLFGNQLTGSIPTELGGLSNLTYLYLFENQLTGSIPTELGGLVNLQQLYLNENQLSGQIPPELGNLPVLFLLSLRDNQLTGMIPAELGNLSYLIWLYLSSNELSGPIPPELGNLANLESLYLSENELTGSIPASLGSLANLQRLYVSENRLTGPIPAELGSLTNLEHLFLSGNQLTGCIPGEFRDVAENDLGIINLPFCDVLLSGLTVSPGSLVPQFDPYRTDYSASVGLSPVTVTLIPTNDHNATFQFLDENDGEVADADNTLEGFQVEFGAGIPAIKIRVVLHDNQATRTYTVTNLGNRYDANDDGVIQRDEVISAIKDYFNNLITREEGIEVIKLYFSS